MKRTTRSDHRKAAWGAVLAAVIGWSINHKWVQAELSALERVGGPGPRMPSWLDFLTKLDHFGEDYFYVMLPFLWSIAWTASWVWALIRPVGWETWPATEDRPGVP